MTEKQPALTIACRIDRKSFVRFAVFDSLIRKKTWRNPLLFALIFSAFAAVCFAGRETRPQAALLGGVLLGVGLILPLVWFGMFFASVRRQGKRLGLSKDRAQYYVTLSPEKIHVEKGKEAADFAWAEVHMACRARDCIYLYVSRSRAFLLPEGEESERAWALITEKLDPARLLLRTR